MACPWFEPVSVALTLDRPQPARAPLGKVFEGLCHADASKPVAADPAMLFEACNFGYGRSTCPRFPANGDGDAVRFTELDGRLIWVIEKDCAPVRHGVVDRGSATGGVLARQAEAFRKACLNR
ncbi:MAG: hypothetical protein SGI92_12650 [Bryobacteraceae bacterium]|nr:hypothetical protein [Bryobacteraceae bacterium]